jgi:alcohol dehydrogenase class IV
VLAGPGSSAAIGAELSALGVRPSTGPVLVVADAALIALRLVDPPVQSLGDAGFDVVVGPGVAGEPEPATIEALAASLPGGTAAAVVAIGGGSAIDAGKLAAAALTNALALGEGLTPDTALAPLPPLAAIPTTAGTGAETTAVAMLWHRKRKRIFVHQRLVPRQATLDPDLLAALPRPVAAASGLDALSHAVESLLSTFQTPLTRRAAESALTRLATALPREYEQTQPASRSEMSLGAHEAGLALNASVVIGHSLAYAIAERTGLSHGVTCAMALPYCLAYNRAGSEVAIEQMAELIGVADGAAGFLAWVADLTRALGIPGSLERVGIAESDLAAMASECCDAYPRPNNPVPVEPEAVARLLAHFQNGDLDRAWADQPVGAA